LAEIAQRLGRKALEELVAVAKPDTLLAWYRKLIANKFEGSKVRQRAGRPRMDEEAGRLVVQMAKENPSWGYDRIVGALANLGYLLSDQTVGNILRRHGLSPAPKRKQAISWKDFIRSHMEVLVGTDFFTVEVWRATRARNGMEQQARNATMEEWGFLRGCGYLLHDRDTKCVISWTDRIGKCQNDSLASEEPELEFVCGALGESVKEECLSKLILFGERSLQRALQEYVVHYHEERNHQGK
jgi:putative transposase